MIAVSAISPAAVLLSSSWWEKLINLRSFKKRETEKERENEKKKKKRRRMNMLLELLFWGQIE